MTGRLFVDKILPLRKFRWWSRYLSWMRVSHLQLQIKWDLLWLSLWHNDWCTGINYYWTKYTYFYSQEIEISHKHILTYTYEISQFYAQNLVGWNVDGLNLDYFYTYPLASWALPAVSYHCFFVLSTFMQEILQR